MRTKNARSMDELEAQYVADAKLTPCAVCQESGPSDAHHPEQGLHFCVIALCKECHQGRNGWHGDRARWLAACISELEAINITRRHVEELRDNRPFSFDKPRRITGSTARPKKILPRR